MSDSQLDGLLDALVRAEPRERWDDVLQRARRARRRYTALVVAVAALVLAPATWAAVKAFEGTPAPPVIKQSFAQMNAMLTQAQASTAAQSSLSTKIQPADLTKAHGVLQVQTPYGPLDLWVAPEIGGKGRCWFISWVREENKPQAFGDGACSNPAVPQAAIDVGPQWDASHPSINVLDGTVSGSETTLEVKLKDGRTTTLPVVEHLVLGVVPSHGSTLASIVSFTGRDASGKVVITQKGRAPNKVATAATARHAARTFRKHWLTGIARRGREDPNQMTFDNLSRAQFRRRLVAAASRYHFTIKSLEFLHPRQLAPLVVVQTHDPQAFSEAVPAILKPLDPMKLRNGVSVHAFEGLFLEAQDEHGVPFLVMENEERASSPGMNAGGRLWARSKALNPPPFIF